MRKLLVMSNNGNPVGVYTSFERARAGAQKMIKRMAATARETARQWHLGELPLQGGPVSDTTKRERFSFYYHHAEWLTGLIAEVGKEESWLSTSEGSGLHTVAPIYCRYFHSHWTYRAGPESKREALSIQLNIKYFLMNEPSPVWSDDYWIDEENRRREKRGLPPLWEDGIRVRFPRDPAAEPGVVADRLGATARTR
jgi:hypothetical protein